MPKVLWTQKQDIGPRPRIGHAMAYDSTRRRVVLFGGDSLDDVLFDDTWEWDGDSWTQVQDIGPGRRVHHAMAFDGTRSRTVLFGGRSGGLLLGDTWEWNGENWTQVADSGSGAAFWSRDGIRSHSATHRPVRWRLQEGRLNDTWEWDGNEWVQQADSGPVSPHSSRDGLRPSRAIGSCCLAALRKDAGHGDTWEWDGDGMDRGIGFRSRGLSPAPRWSSRGTRMALFGGIVSDCDARYPTSTRSLRSELGVGWEALDGATEYGAG